MGQLFGIPNVSTLLTIVQQVQGELGLPVNTTVVGNSDATTTQMFYLSQRVNDDIRRMHPTGWANLMQEFDLVVNPPILTTGNVTNNSALITNVSPTVISQLQANNVQPNFWSVGGGSIVGQASGQIPQAARLLAIGTNTVTMDMEATGTATSASIIFAQDTYRYPVDWDWTQNRTHWDRTNRWELLGPDSAQMDQWHRSGIVATGPRRHWRSGLINATGVTFTSDSPSVLGRGFRLWPQPVEIVDPLQIDFEYLSTNSIVSTVGNVLTINPNYQADADFSLLDDQAIMLGIKWRFWQIKGFNYVDMKNEWLDYCHTLIARDEGAGTLQLTKRVNPIFLSPSNVQDGFFPGPIGPNSP